MEDEKEFKSFEDFWPFYLSQHLDPTCRALHYVGTSLGLGMVAGSLVFPPIALGAPLFGYGMAWIGHLVFEKNIPATFEHPLWSFRGDLRMLRLFITQKLAPELERAKMMYGQMIEASEIRAAA